MVGKAFLIDESKDPPVKSRNPAYTELLSKIPRTYNKNGKIELSIIKLRL